MKLLRSFPLALAFSIAFSIAPERSLAQQPAHQQININTANVEELMRLPGIGPSYAARIVEYRRKHGAFKRPQDVIIVRGINAKMYRQIAHLIRI